MARPSHEFAYADGTPQLELLGAATSGDLALLERTIPPLPTPLLVLAVVCVRRASPDFLLHLIWGRPVDPRRDGEAARRWPRPPRGGGGGRQRPRRWGAAPRRRGQQGRSCRVPGRGCPGHRVDVDAVDVGGRTPLVWAITCHGGHLDIVRYLLDHGASPENVDIKGFTPLHEAAKIGHCEVVQLLLSRGAYVDPFSTYHGTPLHVAAEHKQDGAMKILLDHHADCNKILKNFCSPLMMAIYSHSVKCVNLLLEAGADVKGIRGSTPLLVAAINGLTDVFKPLLDAGADPNARNDYGHLPIELAAYFGTRKDVEILFEVTCRIPAIHDWSVDGIISYVKSQPKFEDLPLSKMSRAKLKEEGHKALHKGEYNAALEFYTMAMAVDPENIDSNLFGTRGFCRLLLGNGEGALNDAHLCRTMRPDCADSCWLQGYSHLQLKEYEKACDAFLDGLKLKPCFGGIEKGLRQALSLLKDSQADEKKGLEEQYREARLFL